MNELKEQPQPTTDNICVRFTFVDGNAYEQEVFMRQAEFVEELLKWFRDKKGYPTWSWNHPSLSKIAIFNKAHIMSIEIDGYIELTRVTRKWYEKLYDKFLTKLVFYRLKGGKSIGKNINTKQKSR